MSKKSTSDSRTEERPHRLVFEATYTDPATARCLVAALREELGMIDDGRATATLRQEHASLIVEVTATDVTALRAAKHTWLSLVASTERVRAIATPE